MTEAIRRKEDETSMEILFLVTLHNPRQKLTYGIIQFTASKLKLAGELAAANFELFMLSTL